jgi:hypothetical protein
MAVVQVAGLDLQATLDRRNFGLDWQAELPEGGNAVGWDVEVNIDLLLLKAAEGGECQRMSIGGVTVHRAAFLADRRLGGRDLGDSPPANPSSLTQALPPISFPADCCYFSALR